MQDLPSSAAIKKIEAMQELLLRLAEDRIMTPALPGQTLRLSLGFERETKKMTFAWIRTTGDDDRTIGFVEIDELIKIEINRRNCTHECAVGGMQRDLPRTIQLRGPKKLATILPPHRHRLMIEIQPGGIFFPQ